MRRHPITGKSIPENLGELLRYVQDELDPRLVGNAERKEDMLMAVSSMIEFTKGGPKVPLRPDVDIDQMIAELIVKSAQFSRARIRQQLEDDAPNDLLVHTAGIAIATGDKRRMLAFAEKLDEACRDPSVHPSKIAGVKKLAAWVRLNATGNC